MTIKEQYKVTAKGHKELLDKVIQYACLSLKITKEQFLSENLKMYVKQLLKSIKTNNLKAVNLRLERAKVREDLDDIERAFCASPGAEIVPQGKNTGGKSNNVETRQLEKLNLKEKLKDLVLDCLLLEKSLESNNKLIESFIELIPRKNYISVLKMTYIDCMSNTKIAYELGYTSDFVDQARKRGIIDLVQLLRCMI